METVLSIIAIVVSSVSLFFNAYPVYCKYMRKKEKTIMTITDGKVENNIIRLCVVYSNAINCAQVYVATGTDVSLLYVPVYISTF